MSNLDKAVDLILPYIGDCNECERIGGACLYCVREATDAAQDLADAGLLALDAPEPRIDIDEWQEWGHKHGPSVALENGKITVHIPDDISRELTREEARELAAWLNAAANHKEGEQ